MTNLVTKPAKVPKNELLRQLAQALREAKHRNTAEHILAAFLWACYPDWFDINFRQGTRHD